MNLDLVQIVYTPNAHDLENCVEGDWEWKKYGKNIYIKNSIVVLDSIALHLYLKAVLDHLENEMMDLKVFIQSQ